MGKKLLNAMQKKINSQYSNGYRKKAGEVKKMRENNVRVITTSTSKIGVENAIRAFNRYMDANGMERVCELTKAAKQVNNFKFYLIRNCYSDKTVHTYISHLNKILGTSVSTKTGAAPQKGRDDTINSRNDALRSYSPRLTAFARCVGIRRAEYEELKYDDIFRTENGYSVIVRNGKGNRFQQQKILPSHWKEIDSFLEGNHAPEEKIFSPSEMENKINLHEIRREVAMEALAYYQGICSTEEGCETVWKNLVETWNQAHPTEALPYDFQIIERKGFESVYSARGEVKKDLIKKGLPWKYSRLATLAVSVFHLAHWRCDVTIKYYFR